MQKENIKITTEYIKLYQLLKFAGLAESGADAKSMVDEEIVSIKGEVCTVRGKKIYRGDIVTVNFDDETCEITVE